MTEHLAHPDKFVVQLSDLQIEKPSTKAYDPNEPRDDQGQWTDEGGGTQHTIPAKFLPKNLAQLKDHPAVDSVDDGRPNDTLFVSLAPGFYWSEQRSFGTETVGEALRMFRGVYWEGSGPPPWETKLAGQEAADTLAGIMNEGREQNHTTLMGAKRFEKYDPNEPRDDIGRWTDGGGGVEPIGRVIPLNPDLKARITSTNIGKSVDVMRAEATINQKNLDGIGANLEDRGIASYEPPPSGYEVKSADSVMRKMRDEGYGGAHEITDYSRASFVIDHPADAQRVVDALRERGDVYDKNWQYIERTGYLDRKVYLQHPNGGLSEIQITPRGVFQVKVGAGHRLYEVARLRSTPREVAGAAMRKSRNLYKKVISQTPFARLAIRGAKT
jgi:hypothetical protein